MSRTGSAMQTVGVCVCGCATRFALEKISLSGTHDARREKAHRETEPREITSV